MEIFNIIANTCSIAGLLISIFVASKVYKISNHSGEIQTGSGTQNVAKKECMVIGENGHGVYYNNKNAKIIGKIDRLPELEDKDYPIISENLDMYSQGVSKDSCNIITPGNHTNICFITDFSQIASKPDTERWIGVAIKSLPMRDWRSFVKEDYSLEFNYLKTESIKNIWIELTNKKSNLKIFKEKLDLSSEEKRFHLSLGKYRNSLEDWSSVNEICFVFFPEECVGRKGSVFISDMSLKKE